MDDPAEHLDKLKDEMWKTQKRCFPHYRPQLTQISPTEVFKDIIKNIFNNFLKNIEHRKTLTYGGAYANIKKLLKM